MRRYVRPGLVVLGVCLVTGLAFGLILRATQYPGPARAAAAVNPPPVPPGDQEIAWLNGTTAVASWERFVTGLRRTAVVDPTLKVNAADAFSDPTTSAVPEVVIEKEGVPGKLRVRWYKLASEAPARKWVQALAARTTAPLAFVGGWSSDRAVELAQALKEQAEGGGWRGPAPLLVITYATAETIDFDPKNPSDFQMPGQGPKLIELYRDRTFRFCFTNRQMAEAVTGFVFGDPTLRPGLTNLPGPRAVPGVRAATTAAAGPWVGLAGLVDVWADLAPVTFSLAWRDDPYSVDLGRQFQAAVIGHLRPGVPVTPDDFSRLPAEDFTRLSRNYRVNDIPFSTGTFNRPNPGEDEAARAVLDQLPHRGQRSLLVVPTVDAPARRVLRTVAEGVPVIGRRMVAVTGDGIGVNTIYQNGSFAWPVKSIPVPLVMFTHADPFGWDKPGDLPAPEGCRYAPPDATEDDLHMAQVGEQLLAAAFAPGGITADADALRERFRGLRRPHADAGRLRPRDGNRREDTRLYFDPDGNRNSVTGEHIVVLRPVLPERGASWTPGPDAHITVYRRAPRPGGESAWVPAHPPLPVPYHDPAEGDRR
jgi:hypothetical protein